MIIYGITEVDSEGFMAGNESYTHLFEAQEEALEKGYELYWSSFQNRCGDDGVDANDNGLLSKEEFDKEILESRGNYVLIQLHDSHLQYEYFEKEIA